MFPYFVSDSPIGCMYVVTSCGLAVYYTALYSHNINFNQPFYQIQTDVSNQLELNFLSSFIIRFWEYKYSKQSIQL